MRNSGKLLILAMFLVAFVAAGASWWFRYSATHRAAQFWGPEAARLIRDASTVELLKLQPADKAQLIHSPPDSSATSEISLGHEIWTVTAKRDISTAPGLTHLRNALLEDRSFNLGRMESTGNEEWTTAIAFRDPDAADSLLILFVDDFEQALRLGPAHAPLRMISTQPIAAGLAETIADWSQLPITK
jgi:hypothetical protein